MLAYSLAEALSGLYRKQAKGKAETVQEHASEGLEVDIDSLVFDGLVADVEQWLAVPFCSCHFSSLSSHALELQSQQRARLEN